MLIGHSWGAMVAAHYAAARAERVSAVVLLDAGYGDPRDQPGVEPMAYDQRLAQARAAMRLRGRTGAFDADARDGLRRWTPELGEIFRAGLREDGDALVARVAPEARAAIQDELYRGSIASTWSALGAAAGAHAGRDGAAGARALPRRGGGAVPGRSSGRRRTPYGRRRPRPGRRPRPRAGRARRGVAGARGRALALTPGADPSVSRHAPTSRMPKVVRKLGTGYARPMDLARLDEVLAARGEPAYRARQVWRWAATGAASYEAMTDLPAALREALAGDVPFSSLAVEEEAQGARRHREGALPHRATAIRSRRC